MRVICGSVLAAVIACGGPFPPTVEAAVIYQQTGRILSLPPGGGISILDLGFTYVAPDFITSDLTVPFADLASAGPRILSVSFLPGCPTYTVGPFSCDEVAVTISGGAVLRDRFSDGAFLSDGNYTGFFRRLAPEFHLLVSQTQLTPVPEPASLALFGLGVVGLAVLRRRPL